jgi:hypothetical protein
MTPAELVKRYQEIKRTKEIMDTEYKESIKPYSEALEAIELSLLKYLNSNGLQNLETETGTAYKVTYFNTKIVDRQKLVAFVKETDNFELFTNSLTKEAVKAYVETHKEPPPGVEVTTYLECNIRKA